MSTEERVITANSSSILDDFVAPQEATLPYQQAQGRIRSAYALLDSRWIQVQRVLEGVNFDQSEIIILADFKQSLIDLNNAILNRKAAVFTEEEPAKGATQQY